MLLGSHARPNGRGKCTKVPRKIVPQKLLPLYTRLCPRRRASSLISTDHAINATRRSGTFLASPLQRKARHQHLAIVHSLLKKAGGAATW